MRKKSSYLRYAYRGLKYRTKEQWMFDKKSMKKNLYYGYVNINSIERIVKQIAN